MRLPQLSQLKPRERLLAMAGGAVVVVVLMDRLVLSPWLGHARMVRQEISRMEAALHSHGRLLERRGRVLGELVKYEPYLKPPVADDLQMAALLKEIQDLAGQSGVEVGEIKPLTVESDGPTKDYSLELRFNCTLDQWVDVVFRLESSPSLFEVIRAGLSTQEERPGQLAGYLRVVSTAVAPAMGSDRVPAAAAGNAS